MAATHTVRSTRSACLTWITAPAPTTGLTAHHVRHRSAFGAKLIDKPLMRNVLADLALESEAATVLMMRVAGAYDAAEAGAENERSFLRLAVPVAKYWVTKRCTPLVAEAAECL